MTQVRVQSTITIDNGAATSSAVRGEWDAAFGLIMPAAFTGATITFTVSHDGATYVPLYEYDEVTNDGSSLRVTTRAVGTSRGIDLPVALTAWPYWKIVSSSNEAAARTLIVVGKTN